MSTSVIAMGIALFAVANLVIGLGVLSLAFGTFETFFGKPKLFVLKASAPGNRFAFGFKWNSAKEPIQIDCVKIRLFNPFGTPTQSEVYRKFEGKKTSFAEEVDFGEEFIKLLGAKGFDKAVVQVELSSSQDGINFQFDMRGPKFKQVVLEGSQTVKEFSEKHKLGAKPKAQPPIDIPNRSFIADTVPGKGPLLKLATNPVFAGDFSAAGAGAVAAGGAPAEAVPNFNILKVWIEPGCIVCNACEDIYPTVFEVLADTCIIRPNAPLDDGLRMQEAAEACPVEVIKYTRVA